MSQTIRQMRSLAAGMGIPFAELVRRRFKREIEKLDGYADENGTIHFRPKVACKRALPGWRPIFKTLTT